MNSILCTRCHLQLPYWESQKPQNLCGGDRDGPSAKYHIQNLSRLQPNDAKYHDFLNEDIYLSAWSHVLSALNEKSSSSTAMFIQTVRTPQRTGRATTLPAAVISKSLFYGLQLARHYHSSKYLIFGIPTRKLDYMTWDSVAWQIGSTGSFKFYDGPFQLPEQDDRKYRLLQLENGLKAVLVHDPSADKAAACATVAVGYLHDPVYPFSSMFCEKC